MDEQRKTTASRVSSKQNLASSQSKLAGSQSALSKSRPASSKVLEGNKERISSTADLNPPPGQQPSSRMSSAYKKSMQSSLNLPQHSSRPNLTDDSSKSIGIAQDSQAQTTSAFHAYYGDAKIDGVLPLFLTGMTQDLFKIKIGEDMTTENMIKSIPKADILSDIQARIAISDFYPAKQNILDFPGEEILVHYDPEFKYGQNFFIAITRDAVETILKPPPMAEIIDDPSKIQQRKPRSQTWKSLGSEQEIENERMRNNRDLITVKISRKMAEFASMCKFGDRDAHDGFLECRPYRDSNYDINRMELAAGIQAVPEVVSKQVQTSWFRPVNFACQYEALVVDDQTAEALMTSEAMESFMQNMSVRFRNALQQNELSDIFKDDYSQLGEEDTALDRGSHTVLQEFQSFTDLKNSKDRTISWIDWHPTLKGILAVSCTHRLAFDDRMEKGFAVRSKQYLIIIWSFLDPIHPQLILEAPEDIMCFRFNPAEPHLVVAGCINGQIVMWDMTEHMDRLKSTRKADSDSVGEDKRSTSEVPVVRWDIVSSIELSHRSSVTDIHWLPKHFEIQNNGEPVENADNGHKQIITSALDGTVAFWDMRYKKEWKALDLSWRPLLRIPLSSQDNLYDYSLTKVAIRPFFTEKAKTDPSSAGKERAPAAAKNWSSKFYCTTEEGDLIYADWIAEKANDDKPTSRVEFASNVHWGTVSDLQRSPFFPDIILSVGSWSFHIWKEKTHTGPLLSSAPAASYLLCGRWSPSRPGVFYLGRADGVLEVWDLLDRSSSPSTLQNVTPTALSYLQIHQYTGNRAQQYIAAGDDAGTLHIFEVPKNLSKAAKNEKSAVASFFEREVRRLNYVTGRKQARIKDRASFEAEATRMVAKSLAAANAKTEAPATNAPSDPAAANVPAPAAAIAPEQDDADAGLEKEFLKLENEFLENEGLLAPAAE